MTLTGNNVTILRKFTSKVTAEKGILSLKPPLKLKDIYCCTVVGRLGCPI